MAGRASAGVRRAACPPVCGGIEAAVRCGWVKDAALHEVVVRFTLTRSQIPSPTLDEGRGRELGENVLSSKKIYILLVSRVCCAACTPLPAPTVPLRKDSLPLGPHCTHPTASAPPHPHPLLAEGAHRARRACVAAAAAQWICACTRA